MIEFDFTVCRDDAAATLREAAPCLDASSAALTLTGHADERGTSEYNYALGMRRAQATGGYLMALGVEPARARLASMGEDAPAAAAHDEVAWAVNRRVEVQP